jgi:DNA primase
MSVIDEVKNRLDIVEIIGQHVQLRKTGKAYLGFCPFHSNTRTPAFTVYPDTQSFYCFGCQASGSVFDFVMRQQGLEFREALEQLAERAGVQLKERSTEEKQQDQQRTRLLDITSLAARYFNYLLVQHTRGQHARDYLQQRDITHETIEHFQLGYSLEEWAHLLSYLTEKKGYSAEEIQQAGLVVHREQGGWYDRFRGRLIFPIRNVKGEVVGFGGRALGDAQPKYLNTPQTLLFDKSHVLYGLELARDAMRSQDACVVVEGYVDVLTAHQHGFRNVVAPLGTSLTESHVRLLKRFTRNVYLALDADAAGQKAMLRGVSTVQNAVDAEDAFAAQPVVTAHGLVRWESDLTLRIITMPPGKDPDDVIKEEPQRWHDLIAQAKPVVDFYIDAYTADLNLADPQQQRTALERLMPVMSQLEGAQQRVYIAQLERLVGIRAELILDMVRDAGGQTAQGRQRQSQAASSGQPPKQLRASSPDPLLVARDYRAALFPSHEEYLLALILRYPSARNVVDELLVRDIETFPTVRDLLGQDIRRLLQKTENRIIWDAWVAAGEPRLAVPESDEAQDSLVEWAQDMDDTLRAQVQVLASLKLPRPAEYKYMQDAESSGRHLRLKQIRTWQHRLSQQLPGLEDSAELQRVTMLFTELNRYLAVVSCPPRSRGFVDMRQTVEKEGW